MCVMCILLPVKLDFKKHKGNATRLYRTCDVKGCYYVQKMISLLVIAPLAYLKSVSHEPTILKRPQYLLLNKQL